MTEVHLIGYTSDLRYLVLGDDPDAPDGDYRVAIDADLFATVDHIRQLRLAGGLPVGPLPGVAATVAVEGPAPDADTRRGKPAPEVAAQEESAREEPGREETADDRSEPPGAGAEAPQAATDAQRDPEMQASGLTPARIQALLRSGRSATAVARLAGTDVAAVERWLPPILEERAQVIREAREVRLARARLGTSAKPLGDAVAENLRAAGIPDDDVTWTASRRRDGSWTVTVRYRGEGRAQQASWRYERGSHRIEPSTDLARELGFARPARRH